MVDGADIDVDPGSHGTVVDDGVARDVRIDRVDPSRGVAFTWWPHSRPDQASTVELVVSRRPPAAACASPRRTPAPSGVGVSVRWRGTCAAMLLVARASPSARDRCRVSERRPLDELFAVLADPTRRAVLEHLVHDGPQTATELAAHFPTDAPVGRQAPAGPRRRRARHAPSGPAARSTTERRRSAWPTPSRGSSVPAPVGTAASTASAPAADALRLLRRCGPARPCRVGTGGSRRRGSR